MRRRYIWRECAWVDAAEAPPRVATGIQVIPDTIDPFRSMADGRFYDSKSAYRRDLRARGYEEVGNERPALVRYEPPSAEADLQRAFARFD